jgi:hypothetical protein
MADVITRFKLETTQYDSKLRDAGKSLSEFTKQATEAGSEFSKFTQKNVELARSFGTIATSATNSKGKVSELVGAYNDVAKAYNALTKEQQSSDFGKALAQSMNTLKGRISEAKTEMNGTSSVLDSLKSKFMINVDALKLLNWGLTAAKKALDVAKDAFFSSEQNVDDWGRTMQASESLYKSFVTSLNNMSLDSFFSNISEVIKSAKDAYNAMDDLATKGGKISNKEARLNYQKQQQMAIINDKKRTKAEREAAQARLEALSMETSAAKKATADLNNSVVKAKISEKLTGAGFERGTAAYNEAYQRAVRSLYDEDYVMGTLNTKPGQFVDTGLKINNGKGRRSVMHALGSNVNLDNLFTDAWRNEVNPYVQAVWGSLASGESEKRMANRFAQRNLGSSGGDKNKRQKTEEQLNSEKIQALTQEYLKATEERKTAIRSEIKVLQDRNAEIQRMKDEATGKWKPVDLTGASPELGVALGGVDMPQFRDQFVEVLPPIQQLEAELERLAELQAQAWSPEVFADYQQKIDETKEKLDVFKGIKKDSDNSSKSFRSAASAIGSVGKALNSIEDPTAKIMGIIAEAIAGVAAGAGQAISAKDTTASGWAWIGAAAAITASMVAMIAEIHNATGFAHGGVIEGTSFSGDNQWARVNAGETILNRAQSGVIASALQDNNRASSQPSSPYVNGELIFLGTNNHLKRSGQGEIVTTGMLRKMGIM